MCPRAHALQQERPPQWKAHGPQLESSPHLPQLEKTLSKQWRPRVVKNKQIKFFKKFLKRRSEEGNGNLLQYPCLKNSMVRGVWPAIDHGVAKSWTRLYIYLYIYIFSYSFPLTQMMRYFTFLFFHIKTLKSTLFHTYSLSKLGCSICNSWRKQ